MLDLCKLKHSMRNLTLVTSSASAFITDVAIVAFKIGGISSLFFYPNDSVPVERVEIFPGTLSHNVCYVPGEHTVARR